jgi:hypothetical protein
MTEEPGSAAVIADLQAQLDEHRAALSALLGEVRHLREAVRRAGLDRPEQEAPPPSWSWQELSGDDRRQAWYRLAAWVDWLVATYRFERWWDDEWYRFPGVVEEVKALSGLHLSVAPRPALGPEYLDWHEALWQFAQRGPDLMADRGRRPSALGAPSRETTAGSAGFARFVEKEVAAHDGGGEPPPGTAP